MRSYISKIELVNSLINNIEFTQSQIINDSLFDIYVNAKCHNVPYNYFVKVFDNLFPQSVEYTEFIQNLENESLKPEVKHFPVVIAVVNGYNQVSVGVLSEWHFNYAKIYNYPILHNLNAKTIALLNYRLSASTGESIALGDCPGFIAKVIDIRAKDYSGNNYLAYYLYMRDITSNYCIQQAPLSSKDDYVKWANAVSIGKIDTKFPSDDLDEAIVSAIKEIGHVDVHNIKICTNLELKNFDELYTKSVRTKSRMIFYPDVEEVEDTSSLNIQQINSNVPKPISIDVFADLPEHIDFFSAQHLNHKIPIKDFIQSVEKFNEKIRTYHSIIEIL